MPPIGPQTSAFFGLSLCCQPGYAVHWGWLTMGIAAPTTLSP